MYIHSPFEVMNLIKNQYFSDHTNEYYCRVTEIITDPNVQGFVRYAHDCVLQLVNLIIM